MLYTFIPIFNRFSLIPRMSYRMTFPHDNTTWFLGQTWLLPWAMPLSIDPPTQKNAVWWHTNTRLFSSFHAMLPEALLHQNWQVQDKVSPEAVSALDKYEIPKHTQRRMDKWYKNHQDGVLQLANISHSFPHYTWHRKEACKKRNQLFHNNEGWYALSHSVCAGWSQLLFLWCSPVIPFEMYLDCSVTGPPVPGDSHRGRRPQLQRP